MGWRLLNATDVHNYYYRPKSKADCLCHPQTHLFISAREKFIRADIGAYLKLNCPSWCLNYGGPVTKLVAAKTTSVDVLAHQVD